MKKLSVNILYRVTSNEKLKLKDEDQLLNFINCLYQKDSKYKILYENVIFMNAKSSSISNFIHIFDYNDVNSSIWSLLSNRLLLENENIVKNDQRYKNKILEHKNDQEFDGIINYLTKKAGGNLHDKGVIEMSSNYCEGSNYHSKNLLDFNNPNYFSTGCI